MNKQICNECKEGIGPTIRYLIECIRKMEFDKDDPGRQAMKYKLLYFFGADLEQEDFKEILIKELKGYTDEQIDKRIELLNMLVKITECVENIEKKKSASRLDLSFYKK